ncbi:MAG: 50S ribosomal protein L11 methyltransferase [Deltaproteobacteria bacterium]|nr:MAG: 50S ribosomal protein L11 methyltransferase [Deltaproteobacteria bacterium]
MSEDWLEIRLTLPATALDAVGQALMDLGCTGITVAERALDTFEPPDPDDGEERPTIRAYFPPGDLEALCRQVQATLEQLATGTPELADVRPDGRLLAAEDWASGWQQHFPPLRVGTRLLIRPSWSEEAADGADVVLTLDPGRAFGTGTHATTALCLDVVARLADGPAPPRRVLDVGAGSGILAMAAAALGAVEVVACEIDAEACQVAVENIAANGLQHLIAATTTPLETLPGTFDLVLANILAGENIRLAPHFLAHLAPGGHLALSGILIEQEAAVAAAFAPLPLTLVTIDRRDEWSCLLYRRHG